MNRFKSVILPPLVPLVAITALAEFIVRKGIVKSYLLPAPSSVLRAIIENWGELTRAILSTSASALIGFL